MADMQIRAVSAVAPRLGDGDLPGYKPKPLLEKAPFVKDKQGCIWQWEHWMHDMGDVLEPCWEAPPQRKVMVAVSPMEIEAYAKQAPQSGEQRKPDAPKRKYTRRAKKESGSA